MWSASLIASTSYFEYKYLIYTVEDSFLNVRCVNNQPQTGYIMLWKKKFENHRAIVILQMNPQ